jgi:hypothetical protein
LITLADLEQLLFAGQVDVIVELGINKVASDLEMMSASRKASTFSGSSIRLPEACHGPPLMASR